MPAAENIDDMWVRLLKEDPEARQIMLKEIRDLIQVSEIELAKGMLRTLIKMTCGFPAISDEVGRNSKSVMRMLSPDIDPGIKAFMAVVNATERKSLKML